MDNDIKANGLGSDKEFNDSSLMKQTFPVILSPTPGAKLIPPSNSEKRGKNKKRGSSELVDFYFVARLRLKEIRQNVTMKIDGHNYEPDFAYVNEAMGIAVDIEVDEPYTASGKPVHFLNEDGTNIDSTRNRRFQDAGWYVFRFSEQQIFCHTKSCMKEVYKILIQLGAVSEMPKKLASAPDLETNDRWTFEESKALGRQHFRRTYLGFDPSNMDFKSNLRCIRLIIPIIWQSLGNKKLRKEMLYQLKNYFFR